MTGMDEQNKKRKRGGVASESEVKKKKGRKVTEDQSDVTAVEPQPAAPEDAPEEPEETEEPVQKEPKATVQKEPKATVQKKTRGPGRKTAKNANKAAEAGEEPDERHDLRGLQKTYREGMAQRTRANFQVRMAYLAIIKMDQELHQKMYADWPEEYLKGKHRKYLMRVPDLAQQGLNDDQADALEQALEAGAMTCGGVLPALDQALDSQINDSFIKDSFNDSEAESSESHSDSE